MGRHEEESPGTLSGISATAARAGRSQHIPVPVGTAKLRALQSQQLRSHVALSAEGGWHRERAPHTPHGAGWERVAGTGSAGTRAGPGCVATTATQPGAQLGGQIPKPAAVPSPESWECLAAVQRTAGDCITAWQPALPQPGEPRPGWLGSTLLLPHGIHCLGQSSCSCCQRELLQLRESHRLQKPSRAAPAEPCC